MLRQPLTKKELIKQLEGNTLIESEIATITQDEKDQPGSLGSLLSLVIKHGFIQEQAERVFNSYGDSLAEAMKLAFGGYGLLLKAIFERGFSVMLKALLTTLKNNNIDLAIFTSQDGLNVAHQAVLNYQHQMLEVVLEVFPESVLEEDDCKQTVFHTAAKMGNEYNNQLLIKHFLTYKDGAKRLATILAMQDIWGNTVLHLAAGNKNPNLLFALLDALGDGAQEVAVLLNQSGRIILHEAIWHSNLDMFKGILDRIPGLAFIESQGGESVIKLAYANERTTAYLEAMLERVPDVAKHKLYGNPLLHSAVNFRELSKVQLILSLVPEAAYYKNDGGIMPFYMAIREFEAEIACAIVEAVPDLAAKPSFDGVFPLHHAIGRVDFERTRAYSCHDTNISEWLRLVDTILAVLSEQEIIQSFNPHNNQWSTGTFTYLRMMPMVAAKLMQRIDLSDPAKLAWWTKGIARGGAYVSKLLLRAHMHWVGKLGKASEFDVLAQLESSGSNRQELNIIIPLLEEYYSNPSALDPVTFQRKINEYKKQHADIYSQLSYEEFMLILRYKPNSDHYLNDKHKNLLGLLAEEKPPLIDERAFERPDMVQEPTPQESEIVPAPEIVAGEAHTDDSNSEYPIDDADAQAPVDDSEAEDCTDDAHRAAREAAAREARIAMARREVENTAAEAALEEQAVEEETVVNRKKSFAQESACSLL